MKKNTEIVYKLITISIFIPFIFGILTLTGNFPMVIIGFGDELINQIAKDTFFQSTFAFCSICIFAVCIMIKIATFRGTYKGVYLSDPKDVIEPIYAERIIDSTVNPRNLVLAEMVELIKKGYIKINELGNIVLLSTDVKSYDNAVDYHFIANILRSPSLNRFANKGISSVAFNNYISGVAFNEKDGFEFNLLDNYIENDLYEKKVFKVIVNHIVQLLRILTFGLFLASFGILLVNTTGPYLGSAIVVAVIISVFMAVEPLEFLFKKISFQYDLARYKITKNSVYGIEAFLMMLLLVAAFFTIKDFGGNGIYFGIAFFLNLASWLALKNVTVYTNLGKKVHMNARILYNFLSEKDWAENDKLDVDRKYDYISYALAYGFSIDEVFERSKSFQDEEIIVLKKFLEEVNKY